MGGRRGADLTGRTFGLVTVEGRAGDDPRGYPLWNVVCECGQRRQARSCSFRYNPPSTHIGCVKAKWAEREAQLEREREERGQRDLELARHEATIRRTG